MLQRTTDRTAYGWLLLAVLSLVFAGIFALLVALARTPVIEEMLPLGRDYIYVALVGHVVLAVVIWFLAFEGFLWVQTCSTFSGKTGRALQSAGLAAASVGVALVVVSAVFGLGQAELANYVPVLLTPVFHAGLALFGLGILLNLAGTAAALISARSSGRRLPVIAFGMASAGLAVLFALICFALAGYMQVSADKMFMDFERLFWGGGHILQFANTIAMVAVWLYLSRLVLGKDPVSPESSRILFALYFLFILPSPFIYFAFDISSQAHKEAFTAVMQWGLGPSTIVFGLAAAAAIIRAPERPWARPAFSSLVLSIVIFAIGGLIAVNISGVNTVIPAHYHCVIGAVTIAFMGLFYEMVPVVGRTLWSRRMATVQPYLYFAGILLFAVGLFIAGKYGVARKTYAGEQNLYNMGRFIGMAVMGAGGLVAIAGGITFVLNAILTLLGRKGSPTLPEDEREALVHKA